jgi:hypothetical protein
MFAVTTCLLWLVWHRLFGWAGALVLLTVFALNPMNSWLYSRWSSTVRVSEQPRDSYLRSFAPHLVGVTPEHAGTGPDVVIVEGKNCPPDPCRALIVGELAFAEQARCPSRRR